MSAHHGKVNFHKIYAGSVDNVFKNVILGKAEAGATLDLDLDKEPTEVTEQLRTLITTEHIKPHPLSAHPRVPEEARRAIRGAVSRIAGSEDGIKMLETVRLSAPVAADYETDYKSLEEIDLL